MHAASAIPPVRPRVCVAGAGPAGLMASIAAARAGASVVLFEHMPAPGLKLLASGGGRCNLTNDLPDAAFMDRFGPHGRFMAPALAAMNGARLRAFLGDVGVATVADEAGRVYPASQSAVTVRDALWQECRRLHVAIRTGVAVIRLDLREGRAAGVVTAQGPCAADAVVVAAGGCGYTRLGATGAGHAWARAAGHTVAAPLPALVPLVVREGWVRQLAGVSASGARVWLDLPRRPREGVCGDVLFTHRGLSGPAVLDVSGDVAEALAVAPAVPLRIEWRAGEGAAAWRARLADRTRGEGRRTVKNLVGTLLPDALAASLCEQAGVARDRRAAELDRAAADRLAALLAGTPVTAIATEGFDHAMVTRGGVARKEVDPRTLASRRTRSLFFAGEVLDLDGPCGGFNLQWAFASGWLAGGAAAERR